MEFIRRGWLETNLEKLKVLYAPRLESMLAALANSMGDPWQHGINRKADFLLG
jgi:hypothetical protein